MMKISKSIMAFVLAVVIVLTSMNTNAFAMVSGNWTHDSFTLSNETVEKDDVNPTEVSIVFKNNVDIELFSAINGDFSYNAYTNSECTDEEDGITLVSMTPFSKFSLGALDGNTVNEDGGKFSFMDNSNSSLESGSELWTAKYSISSDVAVGTYYVKLDPISASDLYNNALSNECYIATITVTEPSAPADDYEIYYELNKADTDTEPNKYAEYTLDETVEAEVFLKNNTDNDITLQAYDIYLTYADALKYVSESMDGVAYVTDADATDPDAIVADENDTVTHIQAIGGNFPAVALNADSVVSLGTINFTIDSTKAVYGTGMDITLTEGSASGGTNISLATGTEDDDTEGYDTTGQVQSYYPTVIGDVDGVEITDTYTVTYVDGVDNEEIAVPDVQTKYHNIDLTLSAESPSRAGYTFTGWEGDDNETYQPGEAYTGNDDLILEAQWEITTVNYTVKHLQQNVDGNGYVEVEADRQTLSGENGAQTEAKAKTYAGFTAQSVVQKQIAADGSTVVEIKYDRNSYTITFDTAGGDSIPAITAKYGAAVNAPANPTKEGYIFAGWNPQVPTTIPASDVTITATWTANTYTVVYDVNTGSGTTLSSNHTYDVESNLTANAFTKTGYTFAGWNTQADGKGTSYEDNAPVKNLTAVQGAEVKLFAQWKPNTYSVQFQPGSGATGTGYVQNFTYDVEQALFSNAFSPTDSTYVFAGWAESEGGEVKYNDKDTVVNLTADVNGVVNLFAVWKRDVYPITYTSNPENIGLSTTGLNTTYSSEDGYTITIEPTATGYTFTRWSTTTNDVTVSNDGKTVTIPKGHTGAVELTANFTINHYTITFDTDGGTTIPAITQNYGTVITAPPAPTKAGHTFAGWDREIPATMGAEDITITANWTINQYTITFNTDGGTDIPTITQDYGTAVTAPSNPTKTGYSFASWDTTIPSTMPADNITITAQWTENQYTIKFNTEGLDVVVEDKVVGYDDAVTLPTAQEITKPGHELAGWSTSKDVPTGTTPDYDAGSTVSKLKTEDGDLITLYPVWKYAKYNVSFDLGANPDAGMTKPEDMQFTYNSTYTNLPNVTPAVGYRFIGWFISGTDAQINEGDKVAITTDAVFVAEYEAINYTITFDLAGGEWPEGVSYTDNKLSYNIASTDTLPVAERDYYTFTGWKVTSGANAVWAENAVINEGTSVKEHYGDVTLTAQWGQKITPEVEEYKYAAADYWMIRVSAEGLEDKQEYKFGEVSMYYIDDTNYAVGDYSKVFYTLIPETYVVDGALTDDGYNKLTIGDVVNGTRATINYNGDINGDGVVNIADANVVYQMTLYGGQYYNQLEVAQRLGADLDKTIGGNTEDHRGSITDVNVIVNKINKVNPTTN